MGPGSGQSQTEPEGPAWPPQPAAAVPGGEAVLVVEAVVLGVDDGSHINFTLEAPRALPHKTVRARPRLKVQVLGHVVVHPLVVQSSKA